MLCGYNFAGKELVFNYLDVFFQAYVGWEILQKYLKYSDLSPFSRQNFRTAPYIIIHPYMGLYYSVYHQ